MADLLKSFLVGNQTQKAQNQAQLEAARKSALEWTKESRAVQGAAEDEYNKLVTMVTGDKWDASMTPIALNLAKNFDTNYGGSWQGKSAQRFVLEALNMGKAKTRQDGGQWQGPPSPGEDVNPLRGTATQAQRDAAKDRWQEENIYGLQQRGIKAVRDYATRPDGTVVPSLVSRGLMDFEADAVASGKFNPADVHTAMDRIADQFNEILAPIIASDPNSTQFKEDLRLSSKDVSQYLDDILMTKQKDEQGNWSSFLPAEKEPLRNAMGQFAQRYLKAGVDIPVIKIMLAEAFVDEQGKYVLNGSVVPGAEDNDGKVPPYMARMREMATDYPDIKRELMGWYAANPGTELFYVPTYDKASGEAIMVVPRDLWPAAQQNGITDVTSGYVLKPARRFTEPMFDKALPTGGARRGQQPVAPEEEQKQEAAVVPKQPREPKEITVDESNRQVKNAVTGMWEWLSEADKKARGVYKPKAVNK